MTYKAGDKVLLRKNSRGEVLVGYIIGPSPPIFETLWDVRYGTRIGRFDEAAFIRLPEPNDLLKDLL